VRLEAFTNTRPGLLVGVPWRAPGQSATIVCDSHTGMVKVIEQRWPQTDADVSDWHVRHALERLLDKVGGGRGEPLSPRTEAAFAGAALWAVFEAEARAIGNDRLERLGQPLVADHHLAVRSPRPSARLATSSRTSWHARQRPNQPRSPRTTWLPKATTQSDGGAGSAFALERLDLFERDSAYVIAPVVGEGAIPVDLPVQGQLQRPTRVHPRRARAFEGVQLDELGLVLVSVGPGNPDGRVSWPTLPEALHQP
jgi:hypothetical protein